MSSYVVDRARTYSGSSANTLSSPSSEDGDLQPSVRNVRQIVAMLDAKEAPQVPTKTRRMRTWVPPGASNPNHSPRTVKVVSAPRPVVQKDPIAVTTSSLSTAQPKDEESTRCNEKQGEASPKREDSTSDEGDAASEVDSVLYTDMSDTETLSTPATSVTSLPSFTEAQKTAAANHLAFTQSLRRFCESDEHSIKQPTAIQTMKSRPAKYIYGVVKVVDLASDTAINHPLVVGAVCELAVTAVKLLSKTSSTNWKTQAVSAIWKTCAAHAKDAKAWSSAQLEDLDEDETKKAIASAHDDLERLTVESAATLGMIRAKSANSSFELFDIEVATNVLRLLLYHSHRTVSLAVDKLPDVHAAKVAGWSTAAAASVTALGVCLFAPLLPVAAGGALILGPVFWTVATGTVASTATTGVTVYKTAKAGKRLHKTKKVCKKARETMTAIDQNIRGFCLYLGYLYNLEAAMGHLNDEEYIKLVTKLNKNLSRDVQEWSNPLYAMNYIEEENMELAVELKKLNEQVTALEISK